MVVLILNGDVGLVSKKILLPKRLKSFVIKAQKENYDQKLRQNKDINKTLLGSRDINTLLKIIQKQRAVMNTINVSTAAVAISRILSRKGSINNKKIQGDVNVIYQLLCSLIQQHIGQMRVRAASNCMWSLGKFVQVSERKIKEDEKVLSTFNKVIGVVLNQGYEMNAINASNALWAVAVFEWKNSHQIHELLQFTVKATKKRYLPQNVSNSLWSMAKLNYFNQQVVQHFVQLAKTCLDEMTSQNIANTLWALQQLRYIDREFLQNVEDSILDVDRTYDSQSISTIIYSFADFGLLNKNLVLEKLTSQFVKVWFGSQLDIFSCIYSLAIHDWPLDKTQQIVDLLSKRADILDQDINVRIKSMCRLAVIYYASKNENLMLPSSLNNLEELEIFRKMESKKPNYFQKKVYKFFQNQFNFVKESVFIEDGQICIGIVVENQQAVKVAVMANNQFSFFVNDTLTLLGRSSYICTVLDRLGWQVVEISEYQWDNEQYRQNKVTQIQNILDKSLKPV
eukprot:TRINITY_DN6718_c0_g1_i9.p1 TRINITY_DN6718_c0_g1~~TRINITY_DN6718_c0_g1_i9.p1  ORF type:complete len:511 (+),score=30.56 TRINITY_DN6718_c0_g1_i9:167-1699(+)